VQVPIIGAGDGERLCHGAAFTRIGRSGLEALVGFAGWTASGFCPGTGVCAAASGRKDALFFIAGGLLGAAAYMVTYPAWKASGMLDDVMGGKTTLGAVPGSKFDGLTAMSGDIIGILMGLAFIVIAFVLPERIGGGGVTVPAE